MALPVCVLALLAAPARAGQDSEQAGVIDFVETFLTHLGEHQFDRVAADLAPQSVVVVARERDGAWSNSYQTGEQWVGALRRNPNPVTFKEPLSHVTVSVDSDQLAYVRADFQVMRNGAAQSQGVDHFTLTRERGGWKIAAIAYTSHPVK